MGKALDAVRRFYDVTENKKGEGLEELLTDGMTFDGPLMHTSGAKEYVESTRQFLQLHSS